MVVTSIGRNTMTNIITLHRARRMKTKEWMERAADNYDKIITFVEQLKAGEDTAASDELDDVIDQLSCLKQKADEWLNNVPSDE